MSRSYNYEYFKRWDGKAMRIPKKLLPSRFKPSAPFPPLHIVSPLEAIIQVYRADGVTAGLVLKGHRRITETPIYYGTPVRFLRISHQMQKRFGLWSSDCTATFGNMEGVEGFMFNAFGRPFVALDSLPQFICMAVRSEYIRSIALETGTGPARTARGVFDYIL